jgi:hypothetical protein
LVAHARLGDLHRRILDRKSYVSYVGRVLDRQRRRSMALATLASPISKAVFPLLVHQLISDFYWWQAWVCLDLIVWVGLIPSALVLARRSLESIGLLPAGERAPRPRSHSSAAQDSIMPRGNWTFFPSLPKPGHPEAATPGYP